MRLRRRQTLTLPEARLTTVTSRTRVLIPYPVAQRRAVLPEPLQQFLRHRQRRPRVEGAVGQQEVLHVGGVRVGALVHQPRQEAVGGAADDLVGHGRGDHGGGLENKK